MPNLETGFYFDFHWDTSDNAIVTALLDKHFERYVVGHEISKSGVHHLQCWTLGYGSNSYTNFMQKVKKLYGLNGRATKNNRKQYGRIKGVVKDTDMLISYCLKEKRGYWSKGLEQKYLDERLEASYTKELNKQQRFDKFITDTKFAIANLTHTIDPMETTFQKHHREVEICTIISKMYFKAYDNVIPNTQVEKTLLLLGLQTHEDLAKQKFRSFITWI